MSPEDGLVREQIGSSETGTQERAHYECALSVAAG